MTARRISFAAWLLGMLACFDIFVNLDHWVLNRMSFTRASKLLVSMLAPVDTWSLLDNWMIDRFWEDFIATKKLTPARRKWTRQKSLSMTFST